MNLLSRDEFRNAVFERDKHKCVICGASAQDAHHILERRLWPDGGYYLENGASLCGSCHIKAEQTLLSCDQIREAAGISKIVLPEDLHCDEAYDKWGNIILSNGNRLKGPLFFDENVQKILAPVLDTFCSYVKYPRTYHLPWSEVVTADDKVLSSVDHFDSKPVVVTIKLDGEQSSLYRDYYHARSIDGRSHPSRDWLKNLHARICYDIPEGWRVCGENLFAKHTIHYHNLDTYFMVFSIWNDKNVCLNWEDTVEWCKLLDLKHVPVLYEGFWCEEAMRHHMYKPIYDQDPVEGYVVRIADSFPYAAFKNSVAKYVNGKFHNDLQSRHHWMHQAIIPNERKMFMYEYDGKWPNLCSGQLIVYMGDKKFEFERGALKSSGHVKKTRDGCYKAVQGEWYINNSDWPPDFPVAFREFLLYKINTDGQIPLPCCGGCC